jgi:ribonuclease BN (tRNA processing enzyme)
VRLNVIGSSPAWPNAGGAHSGYVVESDTGRLLLDCGPGVLARLRESEQWPSVEAIAITHFHLDHWGDLVPWVWGSFYRRGHGDLRPELWVYRGGTSFLEELGSRIGFPDMFERTFTLREYDAETSFSTAAALDVLPIRLPHYTLETYGFRVTNGAATLAYTGDTGPSGRIAELARDADLFVCEATLETGEADGQPRGHLSAEEALEAYAASGARRLLLTHRPAELDVPEGVELAFDGLELEVGSDHEEQVSD